MKHWCHLLFIMQEVTMNFLASLGIIMKYRTKFLERCMRLKPSSSFLSYPIQSYPVLPSPILSYPFFSYPILVSPKPSYPIQSYSVLYSPILSYPILFCSILSSPIQSYPILSLPLLTSPLLSNSELAGFCPPLWLAAWA